MSDTEKVTEPTPAATEPATSETPAAAEAEPTATEPAAAEETAKEAAPATDEAAKSEDAKPEAQAATEQAEDKKDEEVVAAETEEVAEAPAPEPIVIPEGNGELVLVTGATGYLASNIVKLLVESNEYKVRGSVRSLQDNEKLDKLKSFLGEDHKYGVEFVEADLTKPETWTEAVKGCDYVIHTASPFPATEPANADEVIEPTKESTLTVLKACKESGTVKRVVLTSSAVAVTSGRTPDKNACNEEQWAVVEKADNAYDKSKAIAEKAAWDFINEQESPEGERLEMATINPGFMIGPPLMKQDCTSIEAVKKLMNREYPVMARIGFACVDVRDVALAHMRAMVIKQAAGKRHLLIKSSVWLKDMANIMSQEFSKEGFNITTSQSYDVMVWIKSRYNPDVKRILPSLGKIYSFDTQRMTDVLQIEAREVKDSLIEMGHAMVNLGIVQKVEKPEKSEKRSRKLTFKKKKEVEKDLEEGEEKKDEPEKAASTSGSAENEPVADATIEEIEVTAEPAKPTEAAQQENVEEVVAEKTEVEEKTAGSAEAQSEEEVKDEASGTSDPESTKKKDKKEKAKKEKKEKKKGGLFSFSFKKSKKPQVEKKAEESAEEGAAAEAEAKEEDKPAGEKAAETSEETPTGAAAAEEKSEEVKAEETKETPTEEVKEAAPAEEVKAEAPAEEVKAETPAEEVKAEAPSEEVKAEAATEEVKEKETVAADETNSAEAPPADASKTADEPASTEETPSS